MMDQFESPAVLGDVLYADKTQVLVSEHTWVGLVQSIAERDQLALHALYTRMHGIVFTWLVQFVRDRKTAEELTLDVFHDVWRSASTHDAARDSVVGWILNQARSRAIDRLRSEHRTPLPPTIETVLSPPADVLRPSVSLWLPLSHRIAAEMGGEPLMPLSAGRTEREWAEVAPGISCELLATDRAQHRVAMLVRLAPGTAYPPHTHAGIEELYLLHGELMIEDRTLYPGDYNRAEPGSGDQFVWSGTGCMCVLLTSTQDVLRGTPPTNSVESPKHFRAFVESLRVEAYCLDCLSKMYDERPATVWTYLRENRMHGRYVECANCGRVRETFHSGPAS
jgi:DNA-directed RNA polymerase specialized sigma24 family protein